MKNWTCPDPEPLSLPLLLVWLPPELPWEPPCLAFGYKPLAAVYYPGLLPAVAPQGAPGSGSAPADELGAHPVAA